VGPAVLGEPPLLLVRLGEELLHLLLQVHEAPGQPAQQWVIFYRLDEGVVGSGLGLPMIAGHLLKILPENPKGAS
jgi:hypothetical protein